jgi:hypothetical protein
MSREKRREEKNRKNIKYTSIYERGTTRPWMSAFSSSSLDSTCCVAAAVKESERPFKEAGSTSVFGRKYQKISKPKQSKNCQREREDICANKKEER